MTNLTPKQELESFLSEYTPAVDITAKAALTWMRKRIPGAAVLVY